GLLGSLGSILGGAGGGAASGGLGGDLGDRLGGPAGGAGQTAPGVEAGTPSGPGGLFQKIQNASRGNVVNYLVGAEPNQSVSAADHYRVLGEGQLQQLAYSARIGQSEAAEHL
ncbi:YidB family protein, partial [Pseudomonas aeruginosa]